MVTQYPAAFLMRMQGMLGTDYEAFAHVLSSPPVQGLRVNTLKIAPDRFREQVQFSLMPVPWTHDGYYYTGPDRPGKHPYHAAGVYYIQEPSAMAVTEVLDPQPGERVLDLCAAPGGKSTHIGAKLKGEGLLVANEPHPQRVKILSENIERLGITNAVVANEMPERLANRFSGFFDKVLVDAPCSGEGMFRKDPDACEQWSLAHVALCAQRQLDILREAARMLRVGGRLVYSTCTFSADENEGTVQQFLREHANFEMEDIEKGTLFESGRPDWIRDGRQELARTVRLWPHRLQGEGHFIARLRKTQESPVVPQGSGDRRDHLEMRRTHGKDRKGTKAGGERKRLADAVGQYMQFSEEVLVQAPSGAFLLFGDNLYLLSGRLPELPDLQGLRIIRPGWHLGTIKKNRFEPSHALALGLAFGKVGNTVSLRPDSPEIESYLHGDTLVYDGPRGWVLVTVDQFPVGWVKQSDGVLKNHYPKGLRWLG